ncbi:MAG: DNA-binding protein HU [Gammaproteobacteria bacterium RIFCSPLOWO2_02_FULL_42_14]|nr:MAG: DNA-binding protein HU [Gammaproteobacteria bacterium RIFCSPHIGHO2_02_FULL_42_43]OGT28868.1 MAG: DNA-binding protein HU [Gammaproteobacteria bacterium RIFCSPHIGHO2_01_FULL_42_8]OGT52986.1 MAG: DNA-binding protein HU [Gammaproteobacteria bacterium RIFCSPHIGHO2_12_FULL_41_25]OGT61242.1 MAG: DNA-binding protein HU [Gammaproteobacteria bacterium RIFCSPLOWO2_02_FULL_42_14]OGT87169.1 MAG: DNA-binding protein HU [Gammaproteobacteria bacterium RIFCSPLOWO2_12_FULL_42_18]
MNKQELIELMSTEADISGAAAEKALNTFIDATTRTLVDGGEVVIPNFVSIKTGKRAAKSGRNPRTGETIQIPAAITVKFKAGKRLKDAVNK